MKQKTATFVIYTPFGTSKPNRMINVEYKRRCLTSFGGQNEAALIAKAALWAYNQGFTKSKLRYIVGGCG
jgi:hypothetical protein